MRKADTHLLDMYVGWTASVLYGATSWWNNKINLATFIKVFLAVVTASFSVQPWRISCIWKSLLGSTKQGCSYFWSKGLLWQWLLSFLSFVFLFSVLFFFYPGFKYTNALSQHSCLFLRSVERSQYLLLHRLQLKILVAIQEFSEEDRYFREYRTSLCTGDKPEIWDI